MSAYSFAPIGFVRCTLVERAAAPRQANIGQGVAGRIELETGRGFEDALDGMSAWDYAWVLFVFHRNVEQGRGWRPKVLPPRATVKVGVFASRSPHRPNPIGLSAVRIERVEGLIVHVRDLDLLDGTPVLDLKPYVPYADAHASARSGWLQAHDLGRAWTVLFDPSAQAQLAWLLERGLDLRPGVEQALALGPQPHAYRRIRRREGGWCLAVKQWRVDFVEAGTTLTVVAIRSGYRPRQLEIDGALGLHRQFVAAFGA